MPLYTGPDLRLPESRGNLMTAYSTVLASDGGATFSGLRPGVEQQRYSADSTLGRWRGGRIVATTRDLSPTCDRPLSRSVYAAFPEFGLPWPRCGRDVQSRCSWSAPTLIDVSAPRLASQFLPAIAVSDSGVVGVMWLDTRPSAAADAYDVYFSTRSTEVRRPPACASRPRPRVRRGRATCVQDSAASATAATRSSRFPQRCPRWRTLALLA